MAWIRRVKPGERSAELAAIAEPMRDPHSGEVDNILAIHTLHPAGMTAHWELYRAVMRGSPGLPKVERELLALVVSQANGCHY